MNLQLESTYLLTTITAITATNYRWKSLKLDRDFSLVTLGCCLMHSKNRKRLTKG